MRKSQPHQEVIGYLQRLEEERCSVELAVFIVWKYAMQGEREESKLLDLNDAALQGWGFPKELSTVLMKFLLFEMEKTEVLFTFPYPPGQKYLRYYFVFVPSGLLQPNQEALTPALSAKNLAGLR